MIRGPTPTHTFKNIPVEAVNIDKVKITYAQAGKVVLEKRKEDCIIEDGEIKTTLTQEDTFKFDDTELVDIQLRILVKGGKVLSTYVRRNTVAECLDDEVLA